MARALVVVVATVTAGIWLLLPELSGPVRSLTTFLLGPLPAILLLQARLGDRLPPGDEREAVYASSAVSMWLLAALAMLAARYGGLTRADLRLTPIPVVELLVAAGATTAAGLAVMALGRFVRIEESPLVDYLIPRTGSEKIAFAGLSISAGIAEELVFRSFLIAALATATGSLTVAVMVSVGAFAVSHAYQGILGVLRVAVLGLILIAPFILTGSVYPSMAAHTALDLVAGLVLADWLRGRK